MSGARVFEFEFRSDDRGRRMRVVIDSGGRVVVEEWKGIDALGGERWLDVDVYAENEYGPVASAYDWIEMVALACAEGRVATSPPSSTTVQNYHFSTGGGCPITVHATAGRVLVNGDDVEVAL